MRRRPLFRPDLHEAAFAGNWATGEQTATAAQRLQGVWQAREGCGKRPSGRAGHLTVAEAQLHVGDRLLEAAQTLARAGSEPNWDSTPSSARSSLAGRAPCRRWLRHEPRIQAAKESRKYPRDALSGRIKRQLIRTFKQEEGIAHWWLSDPEDWEMIVNLVQNDELDSWA